MMYPRLALARKLLTQDGAIFVSIDDNEVRTCGCSWTRSSAQRTSSRRSFWQKVLLTASNNARHFSEDHEYLARSTPRNVEMWTPNPLPRTAKQDDAYTNPDD